MTESFAPSIVCAQSRFLHGLLVGLCLLFTVSSLSAAEILVVAGGKSSLAHLSRNEVINLYMGGYRRLPDGTTARPIDLAGDSAARGLFYRLLLNKTLEEVSAYWARLVFSGRTAPPDEVRDAGEMLDRVNADPRALGYLERRQWSRLERGVAPRDVKILFILSE